MALDDYCSARFGKVVGSSPAMRELFALLTEVREALAQRDVPERPEPRAMERDW